MKHISYRESGQKKMFSATIQAAFNEDLLKQLIQRSAWTRLLQLSANCRVFRGTLSLFNL